MKRFILEITVVLIFGALICLAVAFTGCVSIPRGPVFTWAELSPGHWEKQIVQPRCPGCPPQTNNV